VTATGYPAPPALSRSDQGPPRRGGHSSEKRRQSLLAYLLTTPALIAIGAVVILPVGEIIWLSMTKSSLISPRPTFAGLYNFRALFSSPDFGSVALNTLIWTVTVVFLEFVVGMAVAVLLSQTFHGRWVLRGLVLLPWIMPGVVAGLLWEFLYDPYLGLINQAIAWLGFGHHHIAWLGDTQTALGAVIAAAVWKGTPLSVLIYMAAYQNVPVELLEAAKVDGAGALRRFRAVAIPAMAPVIRTTILLTTIWTFNYFDMIYVMTGGGPGTSTSTAPVYIYQLTFVQANFGLAAAYGLLMIAVLAIFAISYRRQLAKIGAF
jgi:ABC-type sugar transport system permease subunit